MLVRGAVGGGEADLRKRVLEAVLFCCSGVAHVGREVPAGILGDFRDDEAARYIWDPVSLFLG